MKEVHVTFEVDDETDPVWFVNEIGNNVIFVNKATILRDDGMGHLSKTDYEYSFVDEDVQ